VWDCLKHFLILTCDCEFVLHNGLDIDVYDLRQSDLDYCNTAAATPTTTTTTTTTLAAHATWRSGKADCWMRSSWKT